MISRRDFLRSAGGVTALALRPIRDGLFAAPQGADGLRLPLVTVVPYIQPGSRSELCDGGETMVVAWQTLAGAAEFTVEFGEAAFYVDPNDAALQEWIAADLTASDATWKFAVYHHPAFNVGNEHYDVQHMRMLAPLFEAHGVDIVLSGHEHNYQRARPIRFTPSGTGRSADIGSKDRRVPGRFTVDRTFDGTGNTHADGVLHIVTGAGGKHLYDPEFTGDSSRWMHAGDDHVDYVAMMISDRDSLSVFDVDGPRLTMTQVDEGGAEIDRMVVTKAPKRLSSAADLDA
jgi:hypothetical protein